MKKEGIIAITITLILGVVLLFLPEKDQSKKEIPPEQLLYELNSNTRSISTDEIASLIIDKDPSLLLIDVRSKKEYDAYHLTNAINIPLDSILSDEAKDYLSSHYSKKVFYGSGTVMADQAWIISRRQGFENIYVMNGGLNHWVETILKPTLPEISEIDNDVIDLYQFRLAASKYFGQGDTENETNTNNVQTPKVVIKKEKREKGVQGGC